MRENSASFTDKFVITDNPKRHDDRVGSNTDTLALPPGADDVNEWESDDDGTFRLIWSKPITLTGDSTVRAVVTQFPDGRIAGPDAGSDGPTVYMDGYDYTPQQARQVADALRNAADTAELWAGVASATPECGVVLIEQNDQGTDRLEIACRPFEPQLAGYDGQRLLSLSIMWDGKEEGFAVLRSAQAETLARLLMGGAR